jgi:hypothetical protein
MDDENVTPSKAETHVCSCFEFSQGCLFLVGLGFELRTSHLQSKCKARWPHLQFIYSVILEVGFLELFARADLQPNPLNLSLPSS